MPTPIKLIGLLIAVGNAVVAAIYCFKDDMGHANWHLILCMGVLIIVTKWGE